MSLSKVKSVQPNGSFLNDFGTVQDNPDLPHHKQKLLYKFEYELEDGTILTANHKTDTSPFPAGTEVEYEVTKTHPEYGKSGKVTKPDSGNYKGSNASKGGSGSNRSFALSYAKDVLVASYMTPKTDVISLGTDQMFALAEKMNTWLNETEPKAQPEKVKELVQSATNDLMND